MDPKLFKTGSCSIVLGELHYKDYVKKKDNKLLKITKIIESHNEFKNLHIIRNINNYNDYCAIPDEELTIIKPTDDFYKHIENIVFNEKDDISIFGGDLYYLYIDNAGNKDLLDTMNNLYDKDYSFWDSYESIIRFSKEIMKGLKFLHTNKLCHLDIKPENIMVDIGKKKFRIIDFGFCSLEPFNDYLSHIRGTLGYFPRYDTTSNDDTNYLPRIQANDMVPICNNITIPIKKDYKLVYKIDSYCLGRVLYYLKYMYKTNKTYSCYNFEKKKEIKLDKIISSLTENNVWNRLTIKECLEKYFNYTN